MSLLLWSTHTGSFSREATKAVKKTDIIRATEGSVDESRNDGAAGDDETGGGDYSEIPWEPPANNLYSRRARAGQWSVRRDPPAWELRIY